MSKPVAWIGAIAVTAGILAITMAKPMLAAPWSFTWITLGMFLSLFALYKARTHWRARAESFWRIVRAGLSAAAGLVGLLGVLLFFEMGFWHLERETADGDFVVKRWTTMGMGGDYGTSSLFFRGKLVVERVDNYVRHLTSENLIIVTSYAADDILHHTHVFDGETSRLLRIGPMAYLSSGLDGWSPDGRRIVIEIREALYLLDLDEWRADDLTEPGEVRHSVQLEGWSPDSLRFAISDSGPRPDGWEWEMLEEWDAETRASRVVACVPSVRGRWYGWHEGDFTWRDNRLTPLAADASTSCD